MTRVRSTSSTPLLRCSASRARSGRIADQRRGRPPRGGGGRGRRMHSWIRSCEAETLAAGAYGEAGMPVAGEGAPLVAEFAITEFAAAIGISTDAGKRYVGHALELRHRLPRVWKPGRGRVTCGRGWPGGSPTRPSSCPWTPRRLWTGTWRLTAHQIGPVQLDRLVDEAIGRYMPAEAERPSARTRRRPLLHGRVRGRCTPTTAPWPSTASSTSPTPWTSRRRSSRSPPS